MTTVEKANFDQERELVKYWRDKHYANLQVIHDLEHPRERPSRGKVIIQTTRTATQLTAIGRLDSVYSKLIDIYENMPRRDY